MGLFKEMVIFFHSPRTEVLVKNNNTLFVGHKKPFANSAKQKLKKEVFFFLVVL